MFHSKRKIVSQVGAREISQLLWELLLEMRKNVTFKGAYYNAEGEGS